MKAEVKKHSPGDPMSKQSLFVFRVDASVEIGTGHVMRCLTLADAIKRKGGLTLFVCREHTGNLRHLIDRRGHEAAMLPMPAQIRTSSPNGGKYADWLSVSEGVDSSQTISALEGRKPKWVIVDHYGITSLWHRELRNHAERIMVVDDLAESEFDCDLLLNQNLEYKEADYASKLPPGCKLILGPQYALLKPEFGTLRPSALERRKTCKAIRRILINLGGMDPENLIGKIVEELEKTSGNREIRVDVTLNGKAPHLKTLQKQATASALNINILPDAENMAELMSLSDFSIGAAGASSWERCCLGLPAAVFVLSDNQKRIAESLAHRQIAKIIHKPEEVSKYISWNDSYPVHAQNAARICDGKGCERVTALF